jgi:hypothetical protein
VVTAITASLCCTGPLAATLLGISSFGAATVVEAWRPYFLVITFALLAAAFYFTYRQRDVTCADGTCPVTSAPRWNKVLLWIATVIVILFTAFPYYSGALVEALYQSSAQRAETRAPVRDLTSIDQLKQRFQSESDQVRIISLLSPT